MSDDGKPHDVEAALARVKEASRQLAESTTCIPRWWRVSLERFNAEDGSPADWAERVWRERDGSPLRFPN